MPFRHYDEQRYYFTLPPDATLLLVFIITPLVADAAHIAIAIFSIISV